MAFAVTSASLSLSDNGALSVNGAVSANDVTIGGTAGTHAHGHHADRQRQGIAAPTVTLVAGISGIALNNGSALGQTGATVDLTSTGGINETGGATLTAATLQSSGGVSGGQATLIGTANAIATVGSFTVSGAGNGFQLDDTGNLTVSGPLTAPGIITLSTDAAGSITATGSIGAGTTLAVIAGSGGLAVNGSATLTGTTIDLDDGSGPIALNGNAVVGQSGALVDLVATGNISEAASARLVAATLEANSNAVVDLAGTANAVGALNGAVATTRFTLNDSSDLTVNGDLLAPSIALLAPGQTVTLGAGATIITDGSPPALPGPLVPADEPSGGAPGAYIDAASFIQVGASTLTALGGVQPTLQIAVTNSARFDPPLGLLAGTGWLILDLGSATATGSVFVSALSVSYTGAGGTSLTGTIAGIAGGAAAAAGFIDPRQVSATCSTAARSAPRSVFPSR